MNQAVEWPVASCAAEQPQPCAPAPARRTWLQASLLAAVGVPGLLSGLAIVAAPAASAQTTRADRLAQAEAALASGDAALALRLYEAEAGREHASDIEQGIVRCLMQAGEYRRALDFAAHTAGAHGREAGGSVLYAWLLGLAGQTPHALKVLDDASSRGPDAAGAELLALTRRLLQDGQGVADAKLLSSPHRLAPHGWSKGSDSSPGKASPAPERVRVVSAGFLLSDGRRALVPAEAARGDEPIWLRNGLGQTELVRPEREPVTPELTLLTLGTALQVQREVAWAGRDAFPGSPLLVCDYALRDVAGESRGPAWPRLEQGFLGSPTAVDQAWPLGLTLVGRQAGGPVFDLGGRVVGLSSSARRAGSWNSRLMPASRLRSAIGQPQAADAASTRAPARKRFEEIHELAMTITLEVLRPDPGPT